VTRRRELHSPIASRDHVHVSKPGQPGLAASSDPVDRGFTLAENPCARRRAPGGLLLAWPVGMRTIAVAPSILSGRLVVAAPFGVGLLVSFACVTGSGGSELGRDQAPILGGRPSTRSNVVALAAGTRRICSGTLIAPDIVLTAAHCDAFNLRWVYVGYSNPSGSNLLPNQESGTNPDGTRWRRVSVYGGGGDVMPKASYLRQHPSWRPASCPDPYDIALLRIDTPITDVPPVAVAEGAPPVGEACTVAGYGKYSASVALDASLPAFPPNVVHNQRREARVRLVSAPDPFTLIATGIDGAHYDGDSGGPLLCGERVVGVVSCTIANYPTILEGEKGYANATAHRAFVEDGIAAWTSDDADRPCDEVLRGRTGKITSPGFPGDYPPNYERTWCLESEEDVLLGVGTVDTEPKRDFVTVFNGRKRLLWKLSGQDDNADGSTRSKGFSVTFRSKGPTTSPRKGFEISWW
jgi:hypothetical protein